MPPYTEELLINAAFDVTDNGISLSKVAQKYGVPKATLSYRLSGRPLRAEITHP